MNTKHGLQVRTDYFLIRTDGKPIPAKDYVLLNQAVECAEGGFLSDLIEAANALRDAITKADTRPLNWEFINSTLAKAKR